MLCDPAFWKRTAERPRRLSSVKMTILSRAAKGIMAKHPLAEVFGFPIDNVGGEATRHRESCLCPFNNKVPNCTKDKANNPLGVCSILDKGEAIITCPVRFRERWIIAEDAAAFFFPARTKWTTLTEVRLKDAHEKSAGNINVVSVSYDRAGQNNRLRSP